MSFVRIERGPEGYRIMPSFYGMRFGTFKKKFEAEQAASALNSAYEEGRERVRSDLRDLIGAALQKEAGE